MQSSEKAPGMFGTLVVCLPSPHSGGDVKVKHAGIQKVFSTSKKKAIIFVVVSNSAALKYAVFKYSDVTHEVCAHEYFRSLHTPCAYQVNKPATCLSSSKDR